MSPKIEKILDNWSPRSSIYYEQLVKTDELLKKALKNYIELPSDQRPSNAEIKSNLGVSIETIRGIVEDETKRVEIGVLSNIAKVLNVKLELDPKYIEVRGIYVGMATAHYFDQNDIPYQDAIKIIIEDLKKADEVITYKINNEGGYNNVATQVRGIIRRASGTLPLEVFRIYENRIIDGIEAKPTPEELREAFNGPVVSLEERLLRFNYPLGSRENPKKYSYEIFYSPSLLKNRPLYGNTPYDYTVGDFIESNWGVGEVIRKQLSNPMYPEKCDIIDVRFEDGILKRLVSNKRMEDELSTPKNYRKL